MEADVETSLPGWRIGYRAFCLGGGIVRLIRVGISLSSLMHGKADRGWFLSGFVGSSLWKQSP